jgi:heme/copper-type cytochrome/quinol oxidase subunit 3
MLLEGTGFALVIAIYLYLASLTDTWPIGAPPPDLLPGALVTAVLLISAIPNLLVSRWAEQQQMAKVRIGLIVMTIFGILPLILRVYEFRALHISWDSNAYGSIVWSMLGLHTTHVLTDLADTGVLLALMFTRHGNNPRRFGDAQDNALYLEFRHPDVAAALCLPLLAAPALAMSPRTGFTACAGLIMAPAVWGLNMQLGQVLPYAECDAGWRLSATVSSLCIIVACLSGWVSWRAASRQPIRDSALRFMARLSGLSASVFAFALLLQAIAGVVLTGCER